MEKNGQKENKLFKILVLIIFTGSVFTTSGKFVNVTNTPKFYFVVTTLLFVAVITVIHKRRINLGVFFCKTILWGISIICFLQACYGIFQFLGWFPSINSRFSVTGSFDNPAGLAAVLSMGFPIGLFLVQKSNRIEQYLISSALVVITIAVFLSGSRTGMLAIIISAMIFLLLKTKVIGKFLQIRHYKLLSVLILACLIFGALILYHQNKDSANGRLLIWKVSAEMIKDKPVFGHGFGTFQAKYMDYQAEYFKYNPNSKYAQLADNVKHPFNEFIKFAIEFGMIGLAIILSIILLVFWKIIKSENENKGLFFSGLMSFLVFACFSYPLQYISVWLLVALYLSASLATKEIKIRNTPVSIISRSIIVIVCVFSLFHILKQVRAEIKWETIAVSSLRGNTEKMLPQYEKLYSTSLKQNPFFLYNYGAELNFARRFDKSIDILTECKKRFNDYDLQMLLANNYNKKGESEKAIQIYKHASNMIPCRFLPIYQIFEIHNDCGQKDLAIKYANEIINKKVKIPSLTVNSIKREAEKYLKENEITFGNTRYKKLPGQ